ncbi:copia protein [Tanacetum coccineum]
MTTLAEHIIVAGAKNRPPMLEKTMYNSWASRIRLFIKGKKHGRMMLDSIDNGPLVYPTVEENGQTRPKKYFELTEAQHLQDDCDVQATNIILHGLPPNVETLYEYYWIFSQLINDMNTIGMTMQQVQVNTKFLNALPSDWSKFVTDVKLAKSLYTTNYDQFYAYLSQHERHANEVRINRERYPDSLAFVANSPTLYNPSQSPQHSINPQQHPVSPPPFISPSITPQTQAKFPQLDSYLAVPMFQQGEDPIECINKAMAFLSVVASRNMSKGNDAVGPSRVVKCYNCQGQGHMARQCTQPKRPRNAAWFKEKLMLVEAQEAGQILDEEQLAFLADPAVLMANLSSYDPEVLSEVPYSNSYPNDMINQDVQEMQYSEQTHVDDFEDNEIHSVIQMTDHIAHLDKENQTNKMVNESLTAELERYKERITIFKQRLNVGLNQREKLIDSQMDGLIRDRNAKLAAFQQEINTLKETLFNNVKEKESLSQTLTVFKTESKEKESKYIDKQIVLEKQNKELEYIISLGYQNPFHLKKAQQNQLTLYDGSVTAKEHAVISMIQETLILEEESR